MSNGQKKILLICGSLRQDSSNRLILDFITDQFKDLLIFDSFYDLEQLPHFNPDDDQGTLPVDVNLLREKIDWADGVIMASPEYVFSLPGHFKNALEWTVSTTVFLNKATAIIIGASSGKKAFESLQLIMETFGANVQENTTLRIQSVQEKVNHNHFDEITAQEIKTVVKHLKEII